MMFLIRLTLFMIALMALAVYFSGNFIDISRHHLRQTIEQIERSN